MQHAHQHAAMPGGCRLGHVRRSDGRKTRGDAEGEGAQDRKLGEIGHEAMETDEEGREREQSGECPASAPSVCRETGEDHHERRRDEARSQNEADDFEAHLIFRDDAGDGVAEQRLIEIAHRPGEEAEDQHRDPAPRTPPGVAGNGRKKCAIATGPPAG